MTDWFPAKGQEFIPTGKLRWALLNGDTFLQQEWIDVNDGSLDWRLVEMVDVGEVDRD